MSESNNVIEQWARDEYREGVSAGAAARQLCRLLGAYDAAPTLQRMLEDMLGDRNMASHDRHMILRDFEAASPKAAAEARLASFKRLNRESSP